LLAPALPRDFAGAFDLVTMFLVLHEIRPDLASGPAELRDPVVTFAVMANGTR
jgi:hypothetical protein